jgi:ParB-like chromosome segregation protein Spo0J
MSRHNPPAIVKPAHDLVALARKINAGHEAVQRLAGEALERARQTGQLLIRAKEQLDHGQWLPWLKENVKFSQQAANNYMRVAKGWGQITSASNFPAMSIREAICHLAQEEERKGHPGATPGGRVAPGLLRPVSVRVDTLQEAPDHPMEHSKENVEAAKGFLRRFGQVKPVVVRRKDNTVLSDHAVVRAAREMGWEQVVVTFVDLDEKEAASYTLADNKTAQLAEFKYELVSPIIMAEQEAGQNPIGWTKDDVEVLTTFDFTPPEPTDTVYGQDEPKLSLKLVGEAASLFGEAAELARQRSDRELTDYEALVVILTDWVEAATGAEDE